MSEQLTSEQLTLIERKRQQEKEGYDTDHDDKHDNGEIGLAALCYEKPAEKRDLLGRDWPWHKSYFKPTPGDRVRELVKAGALYRAEIERLKRRLDKVHALIDEFRRID